MNGFTRALFTASVFVMSASVCSALIDSQLEPHPVFLRLAEEEMPYTQGYRVKSGESISFRFVSPDPSEVDFQLTSTLKYGTLTGTYPNFTYTTFPQPPDFGAFDLISYSLNAKRKESFYFHVVSDLVPLPADDVTIEVMGDAFAYAAPEIPGRVAVVPYSRAASCVPHPNCWVTQIQYKVESQPAHGSVTVEFHETGPDFGYFKMLYKPEPGYVGPDSFTYSMGYWIRSHQMTATSNVATVHVNVLGPNEGPVAISRTYSTMEDQPRTIQLRATDPISSPFTYHIAKWPEHGGLGVGYTENISSRGVGSELRYTPAPNFHGTDSLRYWANNGYLNTAEATLTFQVLPVNDAPVSKPAQATLEEDATAVILLEASDVDSPPPLVHRIDTPPAHGTATIDGDRATYTPDIDYFGSDRFTFKTSDGLLEGDAAEVKLTITPLNDPPVARPDFAATPVDTPVTIDVLANDTDPDGAIGVTSAIVSAETHGAVAVGTDFRMTYTPDPGFTGTARFGYNASDFRGGRAAGSVEVRVGTLPVTPGDVSGDGKVNVIDVHLALRHIVRLTVLPADQAASADMNGDGVVDIRDAAALLRRIVGLP